MPEDDRHPLTEVPCNPNPYTNPGGLLGEIMAYTLASAPRPVPEIALAGAIAILAGIVGRNYNVKNTGLNQYVLLLAGTGRGKEAMARARSALMSSVMRSVSAAATFIGPARIASLQALVGHLEVNPVCCSIIGEFSAELNRLSGPRASENGRELEQGILDLFGKSGCRDAYEGMVRADRTKNVSRIQAPALTLLGESTAERIDGQLTNENVMSGLLPRFTIIRYEGPRVPENEGHSAVVPSPELIEKLATLCSDMLSKQNPFNGYNVELTPEAEALRKRFDKFCDDQINAKSQVGSFSELWNRAALKSTKLAALVAVGVNPYVPTITVEQMQWAIDIEYRGIIHFLAKVESGEVGEVTEDVRVSRVSKAISEYIMQREPWLFPKGYKVNFELHERGFVTFSYLSNKVGNTKPFKKDGYKEPSKLIREALDVLVARGDLEYWRKGMRPIHDEKDFQLPVDAWFVTNPRAFLPEPVRE